MQSGRGCVGRTKCRTHVLKKGTQQHCSLFVVPQAAKLWPVLSRQLKDYKTMLLQQITLFFKPRHPERCAKQCAHAFWVQWLTIVRFNSSCHALFVDVSADEGNMHKQFNEMGLLLDKGF